MKFPFHYVAIPCTDFRRAFEFYSALTNGGLQGNPNVPFPMAYFTDKEGNYTGHLFQLKGFDPSSDGPVVYLAIDDDLNTTLEKIEKAGGEIMMPKTMIAPGKGFWAIFLDTEGNRLALHSSV